MTGFAPEIKKGGLTSVDLVCSGKNDKQSLKKLKPGKYNLYYTCLLYTSNKYFSKTVSRIEGKTIKDIEKDVEYRHDQVYDPLGLDVYKRQIQY